MTRFVRVIIAWSLLTFSSLVAVLSESGRVHCSELFMFNREHTRHLSTSPKDSIHSSSLRILFVMTSMNELDDGLRKTTKLNDRFTHTLLPVAQESVHSMLHSGFQVDFYLISHYTISPQRRRQLHAVFPDEVGVEIWDDATPLGYDEERTVVPVMRSLARQHRFVIKDKFPYYDVFVNFEDDMVVHGHHVSAYLNLTQMLYGLRQSAPGGLPTSVAPTANDTLTLYHGNMTKIQLERCIPGFMRVEVALPGFQPHRRNLNAIPIDFRWNLAEAAPDSHVDASICCRLNSSLNWLPQQTPTEARPSQLHYWETSIEALQIRQLPNEEWILLQGGNTDALYDDPSYPVGGYWVGRAHPIDADRSARYLSSVPFRPDQTKSRYVSNQGGWMATRRQIQDWDSRHCRGGFLPPYDVQHYPGDGLERKTVEFWSGGISIAGVLSCNLQRIIPLEPQGFSAHLLYHVSNNKQKQGNLRYRFSSHTVDEFWAQLNTVRKSAERDKVGGLQERGE
jgi:hypothetical protein